MLYDTVGARLDCAPVSRLARAAGLGAYNSLYISFYRVKVTFVAADDKGGCTERFKRLCLLACQDKSLGRHNNLARISICVRKKDKPQPLVG